MTISSINTGFFTSVAFSPDGKTLFDAGSDNTTYRLESFNTANWSVKSQLALPNQLVNTIVVSPDGSTLAVGGATEPTGLVGFVELRNTSDLTLMKPLQLPANTITNYCLSYSTDGTMLAASGANQVGSDPETGSVIVFNLANGSVTNLPTTAQWNLCVAFSPDGKKVADGGGGYNSSTRVYWGTVEVHDLTSGDNTTLPTSMSGPTSIQFSPNQQKLLVGGQDLSILTGIVVKAKAELWNLSAGTSTQINTLAGNWIREARFSPNGNTIELTGQSDFVGNVGVEEIWDGTGQNLLHELNLQLIAGSPTSMSFSPDGKWVTYSGVNLNGQPAVGLVSATTGQAGLTFPSTASFVGTTAMSSDGITVATGGYSASTPQQGKFELWSANSGALIASLATKASVINQVAFSPDGKTVAGAGLNVPNGIEFWSVANATLTMSLPSIGVIKGIAYSPDGTMFADCGSAIGGQTQVGYIQIWTLASKQKITINSGCALVNSVAFSPDGTLVTDTGQTASGGYIVEVWNALTGTQIASYTLTNGWVSSSALFTPDGSAIFVGTNAGLYAISPSLGNILYNNGLLGVIPVACLCISPDGQLIGVGGGSASQSWMAALNNPLATANQVNSLTFNPQAVTGGMSSTGTVTIAKAAPNGGLTISLSTPPNSPVTVPVTVVIPAGQTSTTFSVSTSPVSNSVSVSITASYQSSQKTTAIVVNQPNLTTLALMPGTVVGGNNSTGTVTLNGKAPTSGFVVNLSSGNSSASVPATVTIQSGKTSADFTIATQGVSATTTASITASANGLTGTAPLTITPASLSSITFDPTSVVGGNPDTGTVALNGFAPSGGVAVSLSSAKAPKDVTFPSSVTIPAGSSSVTFQVSTKPVKTSQTLTLKASLGSQTASASLLIQPATLQSVSVKPSTFVGGQSALGTVIATGKVAKPLTIQLSSSSSSVKVPSSVTISANEATEDFAVTSRGVTHAQTVTITAKFGTESVTCLVTVTPAKLSSITLTPPSVAGGLESVGTVYLSGKAPEGGYTVTLASSSNNATVPATIKIPEGKSLASYTIKTTPVATTQSVAITATLGNQVSATLTVTPPTLKSLTLSTTGVVGGQKLIGTITLTSEAAAGGASIGLSSDTSLATLPNSVIVPAGKTSVQFTIKTKATPKKVKATVTAIYDVKMSASFSIRRN